MRWISVPLVALLVLAPRLAVAQAVGSITGVVTNESDQPMQNVVVSVDGTSLVALTLEDGSFELPAVPAGQHRLRATAFTYAESVTPVTVTAGQTAEVSIRMLLEVSVLEGLVAVGYERQRAEDVTGSVASVVLTGIGSRMVRDVTEALTGQLAGVRVLTPNGMPGGSGVMLVRGLNAFGGGASPLYVIDGFPLTTYGFGDRSPLSDIPAVDIESVTVLKDAAAAAIYGVQASNGVVIITTKRGILSERPQFEVNARTGYQSPMLSRLPQLVNATEFATFMNRRWRQLNPGVPESQMPQEWRNPTSYGAGTNWYDLLMQAEPVTEITARATGGNDNVRMSVTAGYLHQSGVALRSRYQRFNFRANVDAQVGERILASAALAPTYAIRNLLSDRVAGTYQTMLQAWPTESPFNQDGSYRSFVWGADGIGPQLRNPLEVINKTDEGVNSLNSIFNLGLTFFLAEGITAKTQFHLLRADQRGEQYVPSALADVSIFDDALTPPAAEVNINEETRWLSENTVNINRRIGNSQVNILAGASAQQSASEIRSLRKNNFADDLIRTISGPTGGHTDWTSWKAASFFGRINYSVNDRYAFTVSLRRDGSSRFGPETRWGNFPAFAAAWNFSNEDFMQNVSWLDNAKLRASLGWTGNDQIGDFTRLGFVGTYDYLLSNTRVRGRGPDEFGNPELHWERTREFNLGIDATMFDGRVDVQAEYYRQRTSDLVLERALPAASGFESVVSNIGAIQNQGFEVAVTTQNVVQPTFSWSTMATFSINRNKVLDLGDTDRIFSGMSPYGSPTHVSIVGQPVAQFFGYRRTGLYTAQDIASGSVAKYLGAVAGDVKFADVNGDGQIRAIEDFEVIGDPWPTFTWGMRNTFTFGRFVAEATMDGQVGGQVLDHSFATVNNIDAPYNVSKRYFDNMFVSWDSIGDGKTPGPGSSSEQGRQAFREVNDAWVQDAGFLWVRNLRLTYDLPEQLAATVLGAQRATLYVSVENPFLFTGCECNPQTAPGQRIVHTGGEVEILSLTPGVTDFVYPIARTWVLGIQLGL